MLQTEIFAENDLEGNDKDGCYLKLHVLQHQGRSPIQGEERKGERQANK